MCEYYSLCFLFFEAITKDLTSIVVDLVFLLWILALALTGPSQTTKIDTNRSAVSCGVFQMKKENSASNVCNCLPGLEPPTLRFSANFDPKPKNFSEVTVGFSKSP